MAPADTLSIVALDGRPLDVPLLRPFVVASTRLDRVRNVAVRLRLADGSEGWGEVPSLPPITAEDQPAALAAVDEAARWLVGRDGAAWRPLAAELTERLPALAATRAGIEMALFDALARAPRAAALPAVRWRPATES